MTNKCQPDRVGKPIFDMMQWSWLRTVPGHRGGKLAFMFPRTTSTSCSEPAYFGLEIEHKEEHKESSQTVTRSSILSQINDARSSFRVSSTLRYLLFAMDIEAKYEEHRVAKSRQRKDITFDIFETKKIVNSMRIVQINGSFPIHPELVATVKRCHQQMLAWRKANRDLTDKSQRFIHKNKLDHLKHSCGSMFHDGYDFVFLSADGGSVFVEVSETIII